MSGLSSLLRRCFTITLLLAGVTYATEEWIESVPAGDGYVVMAVVEPGTSGGEVCGKGGGQHVDFRIDFGPDLQLSVNGAPGVPFDPGATYAVHVECMSVGGLWFATTRVMNMTAGGALVCEQIAYPIPGPGDRVRAAGAAVHQLDVQ